MNTKIEVKINKKQKNIFTNENLNAFGYNKHGFTQNKIQRWVLSEKRSTLKEKINKNQKYIITDRDLSKQGYAKCGIGKTGIIQWRLKEHEKKYQKMYQKSKKGKEAHRKSMKKYRQTERGEISVKKYKQSEKGKRSDRKYKQSNKGKETQKRIKSKRRSLGFVPINNFFLDSHAHHFDINYVIYIPRDLHKSVSHNLFTGRGMKEINDLAFQWLAVQEYAIL